MNAEIGHNKARLGGIDAGQLRSVVERIERLTEEKASLAADLRDVYAEAKGNGFDAKALRQIIKLRAKDAGEREEEETVLETYMRAMGMRPQLEMELEKSGD